MIQNCRTRGSPEDNAASLAMRIADVRLTDSESSKLFDTSVSPFDIFLHHERLHQEKHSQVMLYFLLP